MDPRCAPEWGLTAHAVDEITDFARSRRASTSPSPRLSDPEQAETFAIQPTTVSGFTMTSTSRQLGRDPREDHPKQPICRPQRRPW